MIQELRKAVSFSANWALSRPFYASLDITNYCNLRCEGCDFPILLGKGALGKDIQVEGLEARINALNDAFGNLGIVFAGFEPTIRKDLPELIAAAARRNFVGIVTNGILVTETKAEDWWNSGLLFASVSIPALDDNRFKEIIRTPGYGVRRVTNAVEMLVQTAPRFRRVAITATIDNQTTPEEMECLIIYAKGVGALVSFQLYSASKPASANMSYDVDKDRRKITIDTLEHVFGGSIAATILDLKRKYGNVVGRATALRNFDVFVREDTIPFKPRSLKVYSDGSIGLYPEGGTFSNLDTNSPQQVWRDYRQHVESLRSKGELRAPNCYRCVNLTTPATPIGDLVGNAWRAAAKVF